MAKSYKAVYGYGQWLLHNPDMTAMCCWRNPQWMDGQVHTCSSLCPMFAMEPIDLDTDLQTHEQVVIHCSPNKELVFDCELVRPSTGASGKKLPE